MPGLIECWHLGGSVSVQLLFCLQSVAMSNGICRLLSMAEALKKIYTCNPPRMTGVHWMSSKAVKIPPISTVKSSTTIATNRNAQRLSQATSPLLPSAKQPATSTRPRRASVRARRFTGPRWAALGTRKPKAVGQTDKCFRHYDCRHAQHTVYISYANPLATHSVCTLC